MLLTVDPDGTERVLVDPMALDPTGATTLDAWQPSKEGDLLAYQVSAGGTEESELLVMEVATGRQVDGPIDRTRYSPVAWLPGGEAFYYVRRLAAEEVPADETQYHRRVWLHRLGTDSGATTCWCSARGWTRPATTASPCRWTAGGCRIGASSGTAPRNDLWLADLSSSTLEAPDLRVVQEGVDASTSLHVGRDGRAYLFTDRDSPRNRLAVTEPRRSRLRQLDRPRARGRRGRARGLRDPRRPGARRPVCCSARGPGTRWERSPSTTCRPASASARGRHRPAARARLHHRPLGAPGRRPRGVARLHRPRHGVIGLPLRRDHRRDVALGNRARHGRRTRGACPAGGVLLRRRHDRAHGGDRAEQGPGSAAAHRALRLRRLRRAADPRLLRRCAELGRGRRCLCHRQPARRHRGGRGVAPRRHARAQAERLRRLPRRGRATRCRRMDDSGSSWRSRAAPTAACWSARR